MKDENVQRIAMELSNEIFNRVLYFMEYSKLSMEFKIVTNMLSMESAVSTIILANVLSMDIDTVKEKRTALNEGLETFYSGLKAITNEKLEIYLEREMK